jgi:hypothetical protein
MFVSFPSPCLNAESGGGGSSAPVSSPFTAGGSRGTRGAGAPQGGQEGGDFDAQTLLREMAQEIQQANQRAEQAARKAGGLENVLGGLRDALGGEGPKEKEADWYEDELLPHLFELEKQGKSHPMTATLARQLRQSQEVLGQYKEAMEQMRKEVESLKNPKVQGDQRAYGQIDDMIVDELTSIYGEAKTGLHRAVAANIATDLARIQNEFPQKWDEIRRNEKALANIVKHHIHAIVPPKAREAMAAQVEANTPITMDTLNQAWKEFNSIKHNMDPHQRQAVAEELRRQILTQKFAQTRRLPTR